MQRSETIQVGNASSAIVDISMAVGSLRVSGGSAELMEADFTFDEELGPIVEHNVDGETAALEVRQTSGSKLKPSRNEWDIRLNAGLPLDLTASVAAADATLDLDDLTLRSLDLRSAAGDASVRNSSSQPHLERVEVDTASGDVQVRLTGSYPAANSVTARTAAGDVDLDLSGSWEGDLSVRVDTVAGDVQISVPASAGVLVTTTSMVGKVDLEGFQRSEHGQVNAAFGSASANLHLKITTISGSVTVREAG